MNLQLFEKSYFIFFSGVKTIKNDRFNPCNLILCILKIFFKIKVYPSESNDCFIESMTTVIFREVYLHLSTMGTAKKMVYGKFNLKSVVWLVNVVVFKCKFKINSVIIKMIGAPVGRGDVNGRHRYAAEIHFSFRNESLEFAQTYFFFFFLF